MIRKQHHTIILTATVEPAVGNVHVVLSNSLERLNQYLANIRCLILKSTFDRIIFYENSNYRFDYRDLKSLAQEHKGLGKNKYTVFRRGDPSGSP